MFNVRMGASMSKANDDTPLNKTKCLYVRHSEDSRTEFCKILGVRQSDFLRFQGSLCQLG